jgi:AraC family transcriptional regulator
MYVRRQNADAPELASEFPLTQTHGIADWPKHKLLLDSRGLPWRDVYTSLAIEDSWRRTLSAVPHICLAYCHHGAAAVTRTIEGESGVAETTLRSRLFGVVPEGQASDWSLRGRPSIQLIYLRRSMVAELAEEVFDLDAARIEVVPRLGFADPMLEQFALDLLECAREDGGLYPDHLARMIALRVLRQHVTRPGRASAALARPTGAELQPRLRRVRELIESSLGEDLALERLAREAGIGAHAFSEAFARSIGVTPHRYVLERRIERAKALLSGGDAPISEIALSCGFASQSHLTTAFRKAVGATPREYRSG